MIIENKSTKELVELFNANCAKVDQKPVKKFADRKTAIRRCTKLLEEVRQKDGGKAAYEPGSCPACGDKKNQHLTETSIHRNLCGDCGTEYYFDTGRVYSLDEHGNRSESIQKSWKRTEVKEARSIRHGVKVGGKEYRSVKAAFEALGLPLNEHIKFRMELKAEGKLKRYDQTWEVFEL